MKINDKQIDDIYLIATLALIVVEEEIETVTDTREIEHLNALNMAASELLSMINTNRGALH